MRKLLYLTVLSPALTGAATGQSTTSFVLPSAAAKRDGNTFDIRPFGHDRIRLTQYVGALHLRGHLPMFKKITAVAYRRDGEALPQLTLSRSTQPFWTVRLANYLQQPNQQVNRFLPVDNSGGQSFNRLVRVFDSKRVNFPKLDWAKTPPAPFLIQLKFDSPFVYLGADLAIDHFVYEPRNRSFHYYVDAERSKVDPGNYKTFGQSCPKGQNRAYAITSNPGGEPFSLLLFGAPQRSIAMAILGQSSTRYGTISLPLNLGPFGLSGCALYASIDFLHPLPTTSTGSCELKFTLPLDPRLAGAQFYAQWMVVDRRVSPNVPLAFSDGVHLTLGKSVGVGGVSGFFLYGVGNLARSSYGFIDTNITLVTRITVQ